MIINLFGPIAVGKTHFAEWYVEKHPDWTHLSIDDCRFAAVTAYGEHGTALEIEDAAWRIADTRISDTQDCIWESTGALWQSTSLWTPERVIQGIYSIKLEASVEVCRQRSILRAKPAMSPPYDADEQADIEYTSSAIAEAPANLVVDLTSLDNIKKVYRQIEWHIIKAKAVFEAKEVGVTGTVG